MGRDKPGRAIQEESRNEVRVHLIHCEKESKDANGPPCGKPCPLDAREGVAEVVVVITTTRSANHKRKC